MIAHRFFLPIHLSANEFWSFGAVFDSRFLRSHGNFGKCRKVIDTQEFLDSNRLLQYQALIDTIDSIDSFLTSLNERLKTIHKR